jgi:hypothetical protein
MNHVILGVTLFRVPRSMCDARDLPHIRTHEPLTFRPVLVNLIYRTNLLIHFIGRTMLRESAKYLNIIM